MLRIMFSLLSTAIIIIMAAPPIIGAQESPIIVSVPNYVNYTLAWQVLVDAAASFHDQTGIEVAVQFISPPDYHDQIRANPPAIAILDPLAMVELGDELFLWETNALEDTYSDYWRALVCDPDAQNQCIGVPILTQTYGVFWYETARFDEFGIEPPTTWDEFTEIARQFREAGLIPVAIDDDRALTIWLEAISMRVPVDADITHVHNAAVADGVFADDAREPSDAMASLLAGEAAMAFGGSWDMDYEGSSGYDFFPFPPIDPELESPTIVYPQIAAMLTYSEEAAAFLDYLAGEEFASLLAMFGDISPNRMVDLQTYPDANTQAMAESIQDAPIALGIYGWDETVPEGLFEAPGQLEIKQWSSLKDILWSLIPKLGYLAQVKAAVCCPPCGLGLLSVEGICAYYMDTHDEWIGCVCDQLDTNTALRLSCRACFTIIGADQLKAAIGCP